MGLEERPCDVDRLLRHCATLYYASWKAYRAAGQPFGNSDVAMLIWFTFDVQTRRN